MRALKWLLPMAVLGFIGGVLASGDIGRLVRGTYADTDEANHDSPVSPADVDPYPGDAEQGYAGSQPDLDDGDVLQSNGDETDHGLPTWLFTPSDQADSDPYGPSPRDDRDAALAHGGTGTGSVTGEAPARAVTSGGAGTAASGSLDDAARRAEAAASAVREAENALK